MAGEIQSITAIKIKCKWRYARATRVLCKFGSPVITEWKLMSSSGANGPGKCKKKTNEERKRESMKEKITAREVYCAHTSVRTRLRKRMSVGERVRDNESKEERNE